MGSSVLLLQSTEDTYTVYMYLYLNPHYHKICDVRDTVGLLLHHCTNFVTFFIRQLGIKIWTLLMKVFNSSLFLYRPVFDSLKYDLLDVIFFTSSSRSPFSLYYGLSINLNTLLYYSWSLPFYTSIYGSFCNNSYCTKMFYH